MEQVGGRGPSCHGETRSTRSPSWGLFAGPPLPLPEAGPHPPPPPTDRWGPRVKAGPGVGGAPRRRGERRGRPRQHGGEGRVPPKGKPRPSQPRPAPEGEGSRPAAFPGPHPPPYRSGAGAPRPALPAARQTASPCHPPSPAAAVGGTKLPSNSTAN